MYSIYCILYNQYAKREFFDLWSLDYWYFVLQVKSPTNVTCVERPLVSHPTLSHTAENTRDLSLSGATDVAEISRERSISGGT